MRRLFLASLLCPLIGWSDAKAQTELDLELGPVVTARNDVRIPGEGGTLFSLKDDLVAETTGYLRLRLNQTFKNVHTVSLLYAPLQIESTGSIDKDIFYNGTTFAAGTPLTGAYKFNSYRLSYRYHFIDESDLVFAFGLSAKIRDANIVLASEEVTVERTSLGIVPLPHFFVWWAFAQSWGLLFEGDAYAGPGGRAIDVQLAATFQALDNLKLRAGYRILDGGAGNERVYGFARFHYGALGATLSF